MKLIGVLAIAGAILTATLSAQQPNTRPTPEEDGRVVKITTNLIQFDVNVVDKKGNVITDLRRDEIEIYQNGVKQELIGFSFVSNPQPKAEKRTSARTDIPEPPLELRPEQVRRTIALVVDDLTLSFGSAARTRSALRKYVDSQMQDGDLVGIIRTGAGIGALQQFTTNKQQLYAAIDRVKWNPRGIGRLSSFDPIEPTMTETLRRTGDPAFVEFDKEDLKAERDFQEGVSDFRESVFTSGTLGALSYIVNGMAELPGRKSVVMYSDGLRIFSRIEGGSLMASKTMEFLKKLTEEANKKSVVFYPLDARGLEYTGFTAADQLYDPNTQADGVQQTLSDRIRNRSSELFDSQQGLYFLAEKTGGFAYANRNDLSAGLQKVLEDQSYYLVAYQPEDEQISTTERRFMDIKVKVLRDGARVRHREGFYSSDAEKRLVVDLNYPTKIMRALSSPFALNEISVKLNALHGHSKRRGHFIHSFLHIGAGDLVFNKLPNGDSEAKFDILAISYGDNGQPVDKNNLVGSITVRPEHLDRVKRDGVAYSFVFPVKKPGAYQMRVALLDKGSQKVGSANQFVEVPTLKKNNIFLSGIVLENISADYWRFLKADGASDLAAISPFDAPDPKFSTANRSFRRGSILRFGVEIMNIAQKEKNASDLTITSRVFHDRKLVYSSPETRVSSMQRSLAEVFPHTDAVELGEKLLPGDYVLQVVVTSGLDKKKKNLATEFVQFEVIE